MGYCRRKAQNFLLAVSTRSPNPRLIPIGSTSSSIRNNEGGLARMNVIDVGFFNFSRLNSSGFFLLDFLQLLRRRFIRRILRDQLPAHGEIENKAPQPRNGVGRVGDAFVMPSRRSAFIGRAPRPGSPSTGRAGSRSAPRRRRGLRNKVSGSPWSSATRMGVLDVEIVAARLDFLGADLPGCGRLLPALASRRPTSRCSLANARGGWAWSSNRLFGPPAPGARKTRCPWSARPFRRTAGSCRWRHRA